MYPALVARDLWNPNDAPLQRVLGSQFRLRPHTARMTRGRDDQATIGPDRHGGFEATETKSKYNEQGGSDGADKDEKG